MRERTTYLLEIDEGQRIRLVEALEQMLIRSEEDVLLLNMLKRIPVDERECPEIIHGLCY